MANATDIVDRDAEILGRLAELDLTAAERVHGRLMATEDADELADLGRTYQRLARSLRQTLALKVRLVREQCRAGAGRGPQDETAREARKAEVREAVSRGVWDEYEREDAEEILLEFEDLLPFAASEERFLTAPVPVVAAGLCALLEIPWRAVPPATADTPDGASAAPWRSSA
jgi:hypothetical protein